MSRFLSEDYFEHLLEEIREIRLSERRFYQKITDIYGTSIDYNKDSPITRDFFAKVQNKLHFAIHGHTAADKQYMGLTSWKNSPADLNLRPALDAMQVFLSTLTL